MVALELQSALIALATLEQTNGAIAAAIKTMPTITGRTPL
jgi:hypothetical protein